MGMGNHGRLSFSQSGVLMTDMRTADCEKGTVSHAKEI